MVVAAVLEFAIRHPQTDPGRVFVGGKSVGSIAAWNVFISNERLRGAVLLTPIWPAGDAGARYYPSLEEALRPVLVIAGDQDPYCDLAGVRTSADRAATVKLAELAGDHDLMEAARAQTASLERAGELVADFITLHSNLDVNTLPCKT